MIAVRSDLQAIGVLSGIHGFCQDWKALQLGMGQNPLDLLDLSFNNTGDQPWVRSNFHGQNLSTNDDKDRFLQKYIAIPNKFNTHLLFEVWGLFWVIMILIGYSVNTLIFVYSLTKLFSESDSSKPQIFTHIEVYNRIYGGYFHLHVHLRIIH